jgi:hypothetical protein
MVCGDQPLITAQAIMNNGQGQTNSQVKKMLPHSFPGDFIIIVVKSSD